MAAVDARRLLGAWELTRWSVETPGGEVREPFGPAARGLMVFSRDGWVVITLVASDRPDLARGPVRRASLAARAAAFESIINYCCRWRLVDDSVELQVVLAQNPAMEGTVQLRRVSLRGQILTTESIELRPDGPRRHRLRWRPAGSGRPRRPVARRGRASST